jgi:hypothetical protein
LLPPAPGLGLAAGLDTAFETAFCAVCFCADAWGLFATTIVLPTISSPMIIHAAERCSSYCEALTSDLSSNCLERCGALLSCGALFQWLRAGYSTLLTFPSANVTFMSL